MDKKEKNNKKFFNKENYQLFIDLEKRILELSILYEISSIPGIGLNMDKIFNLAMDKATRLMKAERAILFLFDDLAQKLIVKAYQGFGSENLNNISINPGDGVIGQVFKEGEPIILSNDENFLNLDPFLSKFSISSAMISPIKAGEKNIGVLFSGRIFPKKFTSDDLRLFNILADKVGMALENARLFQKEIELRKQLSTLLEISTNIIAELNLSSLLELIINKTIQIFNASASSIMLWDEKKEKLIIKASSGLSDEYVKNQSIPKDRILSLGNFNGKFSPIVVEDLKLSPFGNLELIKKEDLCSLLSIPLVESNELIGALNIYSKNTPRVFNQEELEIAQILANQVAIAIRNARLFEETQRLAITDFLTNLFNRRYIEMYLKSELARASRYNQEVSVLIIDIDNLKFYNDVYGHEAGDKIICMIAQLLLKSCREMDIVGRYGGDEFIIILPQTNSQGAKIVGERILSAVEKEVFVTKEGTKIPITLSIGSASYPLDAEDVDLLLSFADTAMYKSKASGGGRFSMFTQSLKEEKEIQSPHFDILEWILLAIDKKDHYTYTHTQIVTKFALALGQKKGLSQEEMKILEIACKLHDIGKISIPSDILNKPASLNEDEWRLIKEHPRLGYLMLHQIKQLELALPIILYHHERYNGQGYPSKLKGEDIPFLARILAVVDAFAAMVVDRPYRKALTFEEAINELRQNAGKQFDPEIVENFIELIEKGEITLP